MEQHPIPQQISSYEFKLVGEMTLKQFLKAAGGIVIALLINSSGLIFFLKWPLMLLFGAGGLALAFVPFQDRPLETWVMAFIKSIYSPTIYTYKKIAEGSVKISDKKNTDRENTGKEALEKEKEEEKKEVRVKEEKKVFEFIGTLPSVKREEKKQIENKPTEEVLEKKEEELKEVVEKKKETEEVKTESWQDGKPNLNLRKSEKLEATGKAVFGEIPMPDIPETPNIIVGMVTSPEGKIIEGAIVEIQDESGNPSRVLKTNQLGQFKTTTQLANGKYLIITDKESYSFDRVNVDLVGKIVQPIKIIAKSVG